MGVGEKPPQSPLVFGEPGHASLGFRGAAEDRDGLLGDVFEEGVNRGRPR